MPTDKIKLDEIFDMTDETQYFFPKYTTQLINLANQNCGGTRPRIVGQMTDLIQECPSNDIRYWKKWYLHNFPNAIDTATDKIEQSIERLKEAIKLIDRKMIKNWVEDLVLNKTAEGLLLQKAVLIHFSNKFNLPYRLSKPEEEAKGIDGFIGKAPVSIKPETYKMKTSVKHEVINVQLIYYKKTPTYLVVEYSPDLPKSME